VVTNEQNYFIDENECSRETIISPSGKYKLLVRIYRTKEGAWCYSRGTVIELQTDKLVADVKRCYSDFVHAFVLKPDAEYLVTGRSYMGQTVVNLLTGEEISDPAFYNKPEEGSEPDPLFGNYHGHEFCWANIQTLADKNTLMVDGCHWACPYEYRFYDFTNPMKGWPELKIVGSKLGIDCLSPHDFANLDYDDDADDGPTSEHTIVKIVHHHLEPEVKFTNPDLQIVLFRDGDVMRVGSEWSSERRTKRLAESEAASKAHQEKFLNGRDNAPFYVWLRAQKAEGIKSDPAYASHYPSQNDVTNGDVNWLYPGLRFEKEGAPRKATTATVKWGIDAGDIYVNVWTYGIGDTKTTFERSQEGLEAAYAFAIKAVTS